MAKKKVSRKMKSYESFDLWMEDQKTTLQKVIQPIRRLIKKEFPKLEETVKWGNGCWTLNELPITYLYTDRNSIQVGFFAGSMLKDPKKILEGKGKYVRFITIQDIKDLSKTDFKKLLAQAVKIKYR